MHTLAGISAHLTRLKSETQSESRYLSRTGREHAFLRLLLALVYTGSLGSLGYFSFLDPVSSFENGSYIFGRGIIVDGHIFSGAYTFVLCGVPLSSGLISRSVRALASIWPVRVSCWNDSETIRRESEEWKLLILPKCKIN